jgi:peptide chain release factor
MMRLLLTSGPGPAECRVALAKALAVMPDEATSAGLDMDVVPGPAPDAHGPGSAVVIIQGEGAEAFARGWIGTLQWVAPSLLRPHHKRKNWFIGVFQLPFLEGASQSLNEKDLRVETFRAGGPGGQHQNKTDSAVRVVHIPTGLMVVARNKRSQIRNKAAALERLAELLWLRGKVAALAAQQEEQANHDRLERGRPVRRFRGKAFKAEQ